MDIKTTEQQRNKIRNFQIQLNLMSEQLWTTFLIYSIINCSNADKIILKMINKEKFIESTDFWLEAQPLSPKKGRRGHTEGNTVIDLSFGGIKLRKNTKSGIQYNSDLKWVCFVEAKMLSDCGKSVSYDPIRNQLTRVIENLLVFQNSNQESPERFYFTLLTPRIYKEKNHSRLYGYKIEEYIKDPIKMLTDINDCKLYNRKENNWMYPSNVEERIKNMKINWVTFEDLLEDIYNEKDMNILEPNETVRNLIVNMDTDKIITI